MIGLGIPALSGRRRGGAIAAGLAPSAFALDPNVHYHPASQNAALDGSNRVTACPDLRGLAGLVATAGPIELTDALGRKFWRFRGSDYALVANTLTGLSARGVTVMAAVRVHRSNGNRNFFSPRYAAYTDDSVNTTYSGGSTLRSVSTASSAAFLHGAGVSSASWRHIPGCQLQVIGVASRTTANGGQRFFLNAEAANGAQSGVTHASCTGGVIAGIPAAGNAVTAANNHFDLYEFALWQGELGDADADAAAAAMVANWAIAPLTRQLILEGDSLTEGIPTSVPVSPTSGDGIGMQLTEPGASLVPADCRVLVLGTSGAQAATLQTRKNAANGTFGAAPAASNPALYPGGPANNVVAVQIGRNDVSPGAGNRIAAAVYADVVALIAGTAAGSEGYLPRGFSVVQVRNVAGPTTATADGTIQSRLEQFRALVGDAAAEEPTAQFLADTGGGSGGAYEGRVRVLFLDKVTVEGDTKFDTAADAADAAGGCYDSDLTHLRLAGIQLMASGGDTPQHGYGAIV